MLLLQAVFEETGKRYTFNLAELAKGILTEAEQAKLLAAVRKEIKKL